MQSSTDQQKRERPFARVTTIALARLLNDCAQGSAIQRAIHAELRDRGEQSIGRIERISPVSGATSAVQPAAFAAPQPSSRINTHQKT
jgi:hypothetical protein